MENITQTETQEDPRKPIFVARYVDTTSKPEQKEYLFIYRQYSPEDKKSMYSQCRNADITKAAESIKIKFPEGVKFGLASRLLINVFVDTSHIEQLSFQEFYDLKAQFERAGLS